MKSVERAVAPIALLALLALTAFLLGGASPARADFKESYRAGLEAAGRKDWAAAEQHFAQAIGERGEEGTGIIRDYLPHYQLGVARFERGNCRGALEAWAESERQGAVQKERTAASNLRAKKQSCQARLAQATEAAGPAEREVARAKQAQNAVVQLQRSRELASGWGPFADRQSKANDLLRSAQAKLNEGNSRLDVAALGAAKDEAARAARDLEAIAQEAGAVRDQARAAQNTRRAAVDKVVASARKVLKNTTYLAPYPPVVAQQRGAIETLLRQIDSNAASASPDELEALQQQLARAESAYRNTTDPPPKELDAAANAFLKGEYGAVVEGLAAAQFRDPRATAQACLLRVAAGHALWVLGGERDSGLREATVADGTSCRALPGAVEPKPKYFSPRFLEFWASLGSGRPAQ